MAKDLVIVESPAKARTVGRFLGNKYVAKASMGHVRDLPRKEIGVTIDKKGFHPKYAVLPDKRKIITELKKASQEADTVYLATDPDREGEAISWHLMQAAKIDASKAKRVVFHEITQEAIREAFDNPRDMDSHLINAQQARRILDRVVGYRLSPVLWSKVKRGLSAGRVQSVALRLTVDREGEINAFVPEEYWNIEARLARRNDGREPETFKAALQAIEGRKGRLRVANGDEAAEITSDLKDAVYAVSSVKKKETRRRPFAPFITSTLQQEASRRLRFTAQRTMTIAQQLYEGIQVGAEGSVGLITYMRSDSTNVAASALRETADYIRTKLGEEYAPSKPRYYRTRSKNAQEAHEAIRPTSVFREPQAIKQYLNNDQFRLYDLIWRRIVASQMTDAIFDSTTIDVAASNTKSGTGYNFRASGSVLRFSGYRTVYLVARNGSSRDEEDKTLPALDDGEPLECNGLDSEQKFTEPPPRYSEAMLIRALEEEGIGRPSTYAPIVATILARDYVRKEQGRLVPTKLGIAVSRLLTAHFPDVMDIGFTARVEEQLDDIASGDRDWTPVLQEFYSPFDQAVEEAMEKAERVPRDQIDEETDEVCEKCERPMVIKSGRFGRFLSCSGFPECRNSRPFLARTGVDCPDCDGDLVERRGKGKGKGKAGKRFYGCSNYPACDFTTNRRPLPEPCPECGKLLVASGRTNALCLTCEFKGPAPESEPLEIAV